MPEITDLHGWKAKKHYMADRDKAAASFDSIMARLPHIQAQLAPLRIAMLETYRGLQTVETIRRRNAVAKEACGVCLAGVDTLRVAAQAEYEKTLADLERTRAAIQAQIAILDDVTPNDAA